MGGGGATAEREQGWWVGGWVGGVCVCVRSVRASAPARPACRRSACTGRIVCGHHRTARSTAALHSPTLWVEGRWEQGDGAAHTWHTPGTHLAHERCWCWSGLAVLGNPARPRGWGNGTDAAVIAPCWNEPHLCRGRRGGYRALQTAALASRCCSSYRARRVWLRVAAGSDPMGRSAAAAAVIRFCRGSVCPCRLKSGAESSSSRSCTAAKRSELSDESLSALSPPSLSLFVAVSRGRRPAACAWRPGQSCPPLRFLPGCGSGERVSGAFERGWAVCICTWQWAVPGGPAQRPSNS